MKVLVILLMLVTEFGNVPASCAQTDKRDRKEKILISTDLLAGIREISCNLGFAYRFHPHWSMEAEAEICPGKRFMKKNSELEEHNAELEAGRTTRKRTNEKGMERQDERTEKRTDKVLYHQEWFGLCYWPGNRSGGPFFSAGLRHGHNGKAGMTVGAGWQISVGKHLGIRIEAEAGIINIEKKNFNDCIAVRIGYRF